MRALVTGVAGFIGSSLAARLVADGHQVVGLDDLSDGSRENLARAGAITFVEADLRDPAAVASAASGCEVIYHQGAKRSVPRSIAEPELFTDVNVRGTLNVLLAARAEGARVVAASSSSVYGDQDRFPLVESMFPGPRSPYAASKLAGEAYCRAFWLSMGVRAVSLRYFNVFGPGQDPASEYAAVVPRFVVACLREEPPDHPRRRRAGAGLHVHRRRHPGEHPRGGGAGRGPGPGVQHRRRRPADLGERGPADRRRPDGRQPEARVRAVARRGRAAHRGGRVARTRPVRLHADGRHPAGTRADGRGLPGARAATSRPPSGRWGSIVARAGAPVPWFRRRPQGRCMIRPRRYLPRRTDVPPRAPPRVRGGVVDFVEARCRTLRRSRRSGR